MKLVFVKKNIKFLSYFLISRRLVGWVFLKAGVNVSKDYEH